MASTTVADLLYSSPQPVLPHSHVLPLPQQTLLHLVTDLTPGQEITLLLLLPASPDQAQSCLPLSSCPCPPVWRGHQSGDKFVSHLFHLLPLPSSPLPHLPVRVLQLTLDILQLCLLLLPSPQLSLNLGHTSHQCSRYCGTPPPPSRRESPPTSPSDGGQQTPARQPGTQTYTTSYLGHPSC